MWKVTWTVQDESAWSRVLQDITKSKAGKLADHQPYNLKITLDEGTVPPFSPIYSLSQEELTALHKFIDENLAT